MKSVIRYGGGTGPEVILDLGLSTEKDKAFEVSDGAAERLVRENPSHFRLADAPAAAPRARRGSGGDV